MPRLRKNKKSKKSSFRKEGFPDWLSAIGNTLQLAARVKVMDLGNGRAVVYSLDTGKAIADIFSGKKSVRMVNGREFLYGGNREWYPILEAMWDMGLAFPKDSHPDKQTTNYQTN